MPFPQLLMQEIVPPPPPDKDEEEWIIYITLLCQFISQLNLFYFSPITVWEDTFKKKTLVVSSGILSRSHFSE